MTDTRHALIIANERYDDRALKQLKAPGHDADALAEVLGDPQIGDFDVDVVSNQPSYVLRRRIEHFFSDRRRDDTLVVHFSCHGIKSESGELYFAASDTEPLLLEATAVPAQFVRRCMSRSRAGRTVLFLDCCYGGAFSRSSSGVRSTGDVNVLDSFATERPAGGRGWAVITASSSMEYAVEGGDLTEDTAPRPSVFTGAVVQGLDTGEADLDADGEISLDDLYDYVYDRVRGQNPHQTPGKTVEMQGELHLAHSRRRRQVVIAPEPIPASWRTALHSKNHFTRLGAVAELRYRLQSETLPVAEGARQALLDVAHNDMRQVADTASAHLREIRLQPSTGRLDFGRLLQDAPVPHKTVTLGGLPLARAFVAQPTEPWLRLTETDDGLDVTVDPAAEGRLSADILLKGVADETVIHVEAELPAAPADAKASGQGHARATAAPAPDQARAHSAVPPGERRVPSTADAPHEAPAHPAADTPVIPSPGAPPSPPAGSEAAHARAADETRLAPSPDAPPRTRPRPADGAPHTRPSGGTDRHNAETQVAPAGIPPRPPEAPRRPEGAPRRPERARAPAPFRRAVVMGGGALVAALAGVGTFVAAAVSGVRAVRDFADAGTGDARSLGSFVEGTGTVPLLVASVLTAVVALVLGTVARHDLRARPERYTQGSTALTKALTSPARWLAVPALVLAVLAFVAWLATRSLT
ncbi:MULTISPECIES: caspase, EACC1-associated type [Streptomyces]|uniref:caspase, EACC1-associated type n=1 Tax=Streptomyces TaxID=1883 RepID=UPI001F3956D0|nr:caspase family protein [Streptomyces sp. FB2]MCF2538272.1 caspase family protein [Streptomyces sp. FB2]